MSDICVFCAIVGKAAPATILREWEDCIAIVPLAPVTPGHALVLPRIHVHDASTDPTMTGMVMIRAAQMAKVWHSYNLITSVGEDATQSVFHLHVHIVPRHDDDRLALPWTGQERSDADRPGWEAYARYSDPPEPAEPLHSAQDDIALGLRPAPVRRMGVRRTR